MPKSSSGQLELLGGTSCEKEKERELHLKFKGMCVRGEWFRNEGVVADFIETLTKPEAKPEFSTTSILEGGICPHQCRSERRRLRLSRAALAERAGVHLATILRYENGRNRPIGATLRSIEAALVAAGAEFLRRDDGALGVVLNARHTNIE